MEFTVHTVVTLDTQTLAVTRVGFYTCNAANLTMGSNTECHLDGPSATGATYEEAARGLYETLKSVHAYQWMAERVTKDFDG